MRLFVMELSNQEVKLPDNQRLLKRFETRSRHLELAVNAFMAQFGTMLVKYLFQNDPLKSFISLPQKLEECFPYFMKIWGSVAMIIGKVAILKQI